MTRLITIITALTLVVSSLYGRSITGIVLADSDSTAIAGAICQLKDGNRIVNAVATLADGRFSLAVDVKSSLTLEISMTGYCATKIIIDNGNRTIYLGNIYLNEGIALSELTVTESNMVDSRGRTLVYPSDADVKASATSIGLLQKLPLAGLDVNPINRSMTVDGRVPMILINGVPSSTDDVNALQPKDIARIEYSRITPARYADRNVNGLISITLKKRDDGGEFYGWGRSAVAKAFVDGNIRTSYHHGPSQLSLAYNPSWRSYRNVYDAVDQQYIGNDYRVSLQSYDRNPFNYLSTPIKAKYNYTPDQHTLFSATVTMHTLTMHRRLIGHTNDSYLGLYDNRNETRSKDMTPSVDLFFRRDFNSANTLEVQVVGTIGRYDYTRNNIYDFADEADRSYYTDVDNHRQSLISEINYTHNFGDRTSLSVGYQNTLSHNTNEYLTDAYQSRMSENNNYVYIRLGQRISSSFYMSLASGSKMYWVTNDRSHRHFIRNLTTVQLSYKINHMWNITGAFRYTPSIPTLAALTDYAQQTSPYIIENGNPELKVADNFAYQVMPAFRYRKFSASLIIAHNMSRNYVITDMRYVGNGTFFAQSVNARSQQTNSCSLSMKINGMAGFGANVNVGVSQYKCIGDGWSHRLTSVSGYLNMWWNRGAYTVSYWRKLPGKYLNGHYFGRDENGDGLSLEYKYGKHFTFGAMWFFMFENKGSKYPSWNYSVVNPSTHSRYISDNANMIVLSLSYSANFGTIFRTGKRSLNNADSGSSLLKH